MSKSNNFGKNLSVLRKYKNLTQKELAIVLGVSYSTISMYENNQRHPNIDDIVEIALFFDVSTDILLKTEALDIRKIGELNNTNNNILEKDLTFNNQKVDQGILNGNISNLLNDIKHTALLEHSILNSSKLTRATLRLITQNIDELQEKIIFYQNKEKLKQKIDKIKEKYDLSDIDSDDLKHDLDRLKVLLINIY